MDLTIITARPAAIWAGRARDEFAFVIAADLKAALSAQVSVPVDAALMKASGAAELITALLSEIERGKENAADQAELILARNGDKLSEQDSAVPADAASLENGPVQARDEDRLENVEDDAETDATPVEPGEDGSVADRSGAQEDAQKARAATADTTKAAITDLLGGLDENQTGGKAPPSASKRVASPNRTVKTQAFSPFSILQNKTPLRHPHRHPQGPSLWPKQKTRPTPPPLVRPWPKTPHKPAPAYWSG